MRHGLVFVLFAAACSSRAPAPPEADPPSTPSGGPLGERLAGEAAARPAGEIRLEDLVAELASRGLRVVPARQVLAAPLGADYCASTQTTEGLVLVVCEFASEAEARRGSARSSATWDAILPGRTLLVNGGSLLTITNPPSEATRAQARVAAELFATLTPGTNERRQ